MFIPQQLADELNILTDKFIQYYLTNNLAALDNLTNTLSFSIIESIVLMVGVRLKYTEHYLNYLEDFEEFITKKDIDEVEQSYLLKSKQLELEHLL